jgi:preprotein translocase subunit SecD
VQQISATLGAEQLDAGLLAGIIGLLLVILYSVLYYRGLGLVAVGSLVVAAYINIFAFALLSEWIGFTLTLAGIAGAIVSIGITADSFVLYFERLRDEVREGKSIKTAVETAWVRARRTVIVCGRWSARLRFHARTQHSYRSSRYLLLLETPCRLALTT